MPQPILISSEIFRSSRHAPAHPLAIPRVTLAVDLASALGWLPAAQYREATPASDDELARFHGREYIAAVRLAEKLQDLDPESRTRFNLGVNGNPIYREVFSRPATACGASLAGAALIRDGGIVFNPAGGTHHGQRSRASGYCVFNDPVLAILDLLDHGLQRVFYLDLDAHFGDGVQEAFADETRVFTVSIHEHGRWPMISASGGNVGFGSADDRAGGMARNLPVPSGFNDVELAFLMEEVVLPQLQGFRPQAVVLQCGCDALADDPMTRLSLSNGALWAAVKAVKSEVSRLLVLGGGGYNPYAVGRCWAGVWGILNDAAVADPLPAEAVHVLSRVQWRHRLGREPLTRWLSTLVDPPQQGRIRDEVRSLKGRE